MHSEARKKDLTCIENIPEELKEEIQELALDIDNVVVVDSDKEKVFSGDEEGIKKFIRKLFLNNVFFVILSCFNLNFIKDSFTFGHKSGSQELLTDKIKLDTLKQNSSEKPFNSIKIRKSFTGGTYFEPYHNINIYKNINEKDERINYFLNCITKKFDRTVLLNCINLKSKTLFYVYQVLKMFLKVSTPIAYNENDIDIGLLSVKAQNKIPANVYKIKLNIFNELFNYFPQISGFDFKKMFGVKPLQRIRLSRHYRYFSIRAIQSIFKQIKSADDIGIHGKSTFPCNRLSYFDYIYTRNEEKYFSHKDNRGKETRVFYGPKQFLSKETKVFYGAKIKVNLYSKIYLLKQLIKEYQEKILDNENDDNAYKYLNLNEYLTLSFFLKDENKLEIIQFQKYFNSLLPNDICLDDDEPDTNFELDDAEIDLNDSISDDDKNEVEVDDKVDKTSFSYESTNDLSFIFNKSPLKTKQTKRKLNFLNIEEEKTDNSILTNDSIIEPLSKKIKSSHKLLSFSDFKMENQKKIVECRLSGHFKQYNAGLVLKDMEIKCNEKWIDICNKVYTFLESNNYPQNEVNGVIKQFISDKGSDHYNSFLKNKCLCVNYEHLLEINRLTYKTEIKWKDVVKQLDRKFCK